MKISKMKIFAKIFAKTFIIFVYFRKQISRKFQLKNIRIDWVNRRNEVFSQTESTGNEVILRPSPRGMRFFLKLCRRGMMLDYVHAK
jgi:hypothetical protein